MIIALLVGFNIYLFIVVRIVCAYLKVFSCHFLKPIYSHEKLGIDIVVVIVVVVIVIIVLRRSS